MLGALLYYFHDGEVVEDVANGKYQKWLTPEGLTLLEGWARDGFTDKQIADRLKITSSTLYDWKKKYPEISEAIKKGKEIIDYEVESALQKKCTGYYVPEESVVKCKRVYWDENGRRCEEEKVEVVIIQRYIPPDTTAQLAWLNNRRSDRWRRNAGKERLDEKKFEHEKDIDGKRYW